MLSQEFKFQALLLKVLDSELLELHVSQIQVSAHMETQMETILLTGLLARSKLTDASNMEDLILLLPQLIPMLGKELFLVTLILEIHGRK